MTNLYGCDVEALRGFLARYDLPAFHASQIYAWLYARRRFDPADWSDLPASLRERLQCDAVFDPGKIVARTTATDGTIKYGISPDGGGTIEAVYMHYDDRVTLCVSSQVGCALDCDFCLTGKMGFVRHLSPGEILGQVAQIQNDRGLGERPFNLVFMGMGEPLHNYDAVLAAFRVLVDPRGFGLSRKRITVSTSGLVPAIEQLAAEPRRPRLAVSLNATTDETRERIMPINRKYPLARLLEACREYTTTTGERITFEYVLLDGVNVADDDLERLAEMTRSLAVKVNLIPFNPVPDRLPYRPPSRQRVLQIRDELLRRDVPASIRWSRGTEARAACGQLATEATR
ncbi:MAG: 23S rRNA (adenine(2503)-C(2))-methyltransferase RlmN [bacterium]|nr:23S rRNA (adenine(2503)-C(2))-methyltransferase RlmN [bacterium]